MPCATRLLSEQAFHDEQARRRARDLSERSLVFDDDAYLDHESWIRPAIARLGDMRGRRVLDLGCGHGMAAIVLAGRAADSPTPAKSAPATKNRSMLAASLNCACSSRTSWSKVISYWP